MAIFLIANGAMPTTAAFVAVTTGTALKTMLQVKPVAGVTLRIAEWGFSFNASALAVPIVVELCTTGAIAATVTAHVEAGIVKLRDSADLAATYMTLGTAATGYTGSAEGAIVASRTLAGPIFASVLSQPFIQQFPLGQEPEIWGTITPVFASPRAPPSICIAT